MFALQNKCVIFVNHLSSVNRNVFPASLPVLMERIVSHLFKVLANLFYEVEARRRAMFPVVIRRRRRGPRTHSHLGLPTSPPHGSEPS